MVGPTGLNAYAPLVHVRSTVCMCSTAQKTRVVAPLRQLAVRFNTIAFPPIVYQLSFPSMFFPIPSADPPADIGPPPCVRRDLKKTLQLVASMTCVLVYYRLGMLTSVPIYSRHAAIVTFLGAVKAHENSCYTVVHMH